MDPTVVAIALAIGLDNLPVTLGLGFSARTRGQLRAYAAGFLIAEASMPLIGGLIGATLAAAVSPLATLLGCAVLGLAILHLVLGKEGIPEGRSFALLPIWLGFDNAAAGAALALLGYGPLVIGATGLLAGSLSVVGLFVGRLLSVRTVSAATRLPAAALLGVAIVLRVM
jgi:putative Mn2+ efflux pump MntP